MITSWKDLMKRLTFAFVDDPPVNTLSEAGGSGVDDVKILHEA